MREMFSEMWDMGLGWVLLGLGVLIGLLGGASFLYQTQTVEERTCTITGMDRTTKDGSSDMRVYTEECGTLKVSDALFHGQFDSADLYGALETGETYDFTTFGWRIPVLSEFPTIYEAEVAR